MSDNNGKKQKTSSEDSKEQQFFDRLDGNDGLIKLILSYLTREDGYEYVKYLKEGLFKPKNDDTEKAIKEKKDFMNRLDTFLAKCARLYHLIQRYREDFPRGTPIVCACERGHMADVELFVNLHPYHKYITNRDVNGYRDDMTLKDMVSQFGRTSEGVERTPLMIAAAYEHFQVAKYLIEQGADPNIVGSNGWNALHYAASNNRTNTELIELLLPHMTLASINKKDRAGDTPLDCVYLLNDSPIRQEIIALILAKGGKANCFDANGIFVGVGNGDLNQLLKF